MKSKNRMRVIAINALLFAALFGIISLNKEVIRPRMGESLLINVITGCFPNFIAAYLISLASVSAVYIRKWKRGRLIVVSSAIVVFIILAIEELKPMWGASTYFDSYDIIASGIGSLLAILTYELLYFLKRKKLS
jgi:hypothetical protein